MIRSLYAIPATFCLAAAVLTAQAPAGDKPASYPPATQQPAGQQPSSKMTGNKMTYVGCLKPGTSTGTWVLENAEAQKGGAADSGAVATSGKSTTTLSLDPAATVNLKAHANHKVEIVGMMSAAPGAAATEPKSGEAAAGVAGPTDAKGGEPTTAGGHGAAGTAPAGTRASGHHFSVESLKMVSATCP